MKNKKIISAVMAMAMTVSTMTAFSAFAVDLTDPDDTVGGNIRRDAMEVTFGQYVSKTAELQPSLARVNGDDDWYKFTIDTTSKVNVDVEISNTLAIGSYYEIIDADRDNNVVLKNTTIDQSTTYFPAVLYLSAGEYYIHLYTSSGNNCNYDLKVKSTPVEESFTGNTNNALSKATPIEFDTEYSGIIGHNDEADYYTFNVEEEGLVTFYFNGNMKDVDWKILNGKKDTDDNIVQSGTFSQLETDDSISVIKSYVMTPGKFTLVLTKHDTPLASNSNDAEILAKILNDSGYGDYTFSLEYVKDYNNISTSEGFVPADVNKDHHVDATDASAISAFYAYLSTGGTETDMSIWYETIFTNKNE